MLTARVSNCVRGSSRGLLQRAAPAFSRFVSVPGSGQAEPPSQVIKHYAKACDGAKGKNQCVHCVLRGGTVKVNCEESRAYYDRCQSFKECSVEAQDKAQAESK